LREHWQFALPEPALAARAKEITGRNHCVAWHAATLAGQRYIPRLAGQHKDYLLEQLNGFKASKRADHDATMTSAAQGLTAEELAPLADYLSTLVAP
jgi:cytochrome c553